MQTTETLQTEEMQGWNWPSNNRIGRKKVSRTILAQDVFDLEKAWLFARQVGRPLNVFLSIRPLDIEERSPQERQRYWQTILNKIAQYARDRGFEPTYVWTRESEPTTGKKEHLHVLVHTPSHLREHFKALAESWLGQGEVDARNATYAERWVDGKKKSVIRYVTKNSPQAAYACPDRLFRRGGPVLGKRAGCTRNLDENARARSQARQAIHREFGHDRAILKTTLH